MCGESRTHGFEAEGKKATSGSTVTVTGNSVSVTSYQSPVKTGNGEQ
ncbi:hypothetical protein CKA32_005033 [Geitlerinema sp. FC II]|nr:hypothetical protein CKA32_005033 [Geitlerinema sp. FC II]